ncbi:MAG: methyltransferase [Geminicoccaceae bacterium]
MFAARDRLLANPRFQRWAASFPLTRRVAQNNARELFDLCAGFVYSQVLFACVRLRLFEALSDGPQTTAELAQRLSVPPTAMRRLLEAAEGLGLVASRGPDRFGLGMLGAAMLGNPGVAAMIEHHAMLYDDLRDPVALLRGETQARELARYWAYAGRPESMSVEDVEAYTTLMAASQPLVATDILDAYALAPHRCILDVGGGNGTFLRAVAERAPHLQLKLFDLPAVAELAAGRPGPSIECIGGDFLNDPLPPGADVISLVRIVHDHDDPAVARLLAGARAALPAGGTLLLAEPMAGTAGAESVGAYFSMYLLAMGSGRPRTVETLQRMLAHAGFASSREVATRRPMLVRLIVARA